jgi:hypothetical protein
MRLRSGSSGNKSIWKNPKSERLDRFGFLKNFSKAFSPQRQRSQSKPIFSSGGRYRQRKTALRYAVRKPPQAGGSFLKIGISRF